MSLSSASCLFFLTFPFFNSSISVFKSPHSHPTLHHNSRCKPVLLVPNPVTVPQRTYMLPALSSQSQYNSLHS
jgi:hypothetical protein